MDRYKIQLVSILYHVDLACVSAFKINARLSRGYSFEFLVDCVVHTSGKEPFLLILNSFYLRQKEE